MLVTVAVAAALIGLGAPPMHRLLARRAVAAQADVLLDALRVARSEAMKRGGPVILCKTDPRVAATAAVSCATDSRIGWQTWIVFVDANRSAGHDAGDPEIRVQKDPPARLDVSSDPALASVRFEPTGIALANTGAARVAFVVAASPGSGEDLASVARRVVCLNSRGLAADIDGGGTCP
jgi:type IV fimbrial biogenesis protein FimT